MKPLKSSLLAIMAMVLGACQSKMGVNFTIVNKAGSTVDSLTIEPNVNTQYLNIDNNSKASYITNMEGIAKRDGAYQLKFKKGADYMHYTFGYYTNGAPLESFTTITLQPDTILIDELY